MAITLASADALVRPESVGPLLIEPLTKASFAMQVSTNVQTNSESYRLPKLSEHPPVGWQQENVDWDLGDATFDEIDVKFFKAGGAVRLSTEICESSDPQAATIIGQSLASALARTIDKAFWGNTIALGPNGIESLTDVQHVDAGSDWTDLDALVEGISKLQAIGATPTHFVTNASTALALSKLKKFTGDVGSNENLLQASPTTPTVMQVNGVPIVVVPDDTIEPGVVWLSDQSRQYVVMKRNVTIDVSREVFWQADAVGVKVSARVGYGWPSEQSLCRIAISGS